MIQAIGKGDLKEICSLMVNQLEPAAVAEYPVIAEIEKDLVEMGATGAMMTGSGPTVFGLFEDKSSAQVACDRLSELYKQVFLSETV
jgi:4-diphosphocytidyl-2-C-methyl-D-erythritol kinase